MLTVSQINNIRNLYRRTRNISETARLAGCSRVTVDKYLKADLSEKKPSPRKKGKSILDDYKQYIEEILLEDMRRWSKQRHTIEVIYQLLNNKGYAGSRTTIWRYVRKRRKELNYHLKTYQRLNWPKGAAQVDLGEAEMDVCGRMVRLSYLVMSFPYSNNAYIQILRDQTAVSFCGALSDIFAHVGGVPHRLVIDNATQAVKRIDKKITESKVFGRFRAHYNFELDVCNPNSGHEKGNVENKIGFLRRNMLVVNNSIDDLDQFNAMLLTEAEKLQFKRVRKGDLMTCGDLFAEERTVLFELPANKYQPMEILAARTNKHGEVTYNGKKYHASYNCVQSEVMIAATPSEIIVLDKDDRTEIRRIPRDLKFLNRRGGQPSVTEALDQAIKKPHSWRESELRRMLTPDVYLHLDNVDSDRLTRLLSTIQRCSDGDDRSIIDRLGMLVKSEIAKNEEILNVYESCKAGSTSALNEYDELLGVDGGV